MHRIDTSTAVAELPATGAAGTPGYFIDGDAGTGQAATQFNQDFFNMLQEEGCAITALMGIAPVKGVYNQMATALALATQSSYGTWALEAGGSAVNAYVVATTPLAMTAAPPNGTVIRALIVTGASTHAATLNCGWGSVNILHHDGSHLRYGDVVAGVNEFVYYNGAWRIPRPTRTKLGAALTLYVNAATGNDGNDGLTAATALATPWGAAALLVANYDLGSQNVTISVADGNYNGGVSLNGPLPGQAGPDSLIFSGDSGVLWSNPGASCISATSGGGCKLIGGTLSGGTPLYASYDGLIRFSGTVFGAATINAQIESSYGADIVPEGPYSITGGGPAHVLAEAGGSFSLPAAGIVCTITGTPNFATAFIQASDQGKIIIPSTYGSYTGAITGKQYALQTGGLINTSGGGGAYLPGSGNTNDGTGIFA